MKKVVLAYSGGLDTSCCAQWLRDRNYEVICFIADLGQEEDFVKIEKRALSGGASKVYIKDLRQEFVDDFIFPALKANAIYEGKYLLATALGRPLIAKYLVDVAHKEKAKAIAHGCTGKGNDQVRFEVTTQILDPELEIIAPVRIWEFKSREEEIGYALAKKIPIEATKKKPYSIDKNLWGVSIESGILENPWIEPPEDCYQWTKSPESAPHKAGYIELTFEKGIPKKINGKIYDGIGLIEKLNKIGSLHGIGRSDLIENRLVGIKSREIYEAPAGTILYLAHKELESLVLDRELAHYKDGMSPKYAEFIYYGLWYSPLRIALDKFIAETQKNVTGAVKLKLYKGNCIVTGKKSPYSLYRQDLATYSSGDKFDQRLAQGFIRIFGMPYQMKPRLTER
ncbi:MAG: argininosuccinate synthase [Omnitrophica WOR_2 bacterium RIFCSPLOWO2_12_FULL_46_30]|nr:MAG: argininosuccinate synthase [Omnitrophica WOR_2 bacterium RIFCSPHIGHO2_02_FULL_46_37]OGX42394.1 MAG: argininosuccinate synthase [Omnitrophica WOR_2 bacterium RIFCSPLOWO2_02_FULL_45_28]OGX50372.1 MAG: argininosuccinate synthase [Omnitrophica WOR_2 bacterium RIFCSPLOWO2_12_FULL_46_30]